ncbi:hypothetical protein [Actinoallomurus rhizosphaericola]|uniref:hypothetical protein n=1 Tax=Actinoallomurus rhizosphaericola TaxID=2952536 RepID=UPI002093629E|nr:hypothetical protein [Actinoallomurus rhizosphaericola]MCO5997435.1 hypothetical protein [Actinoallomurus rhizosphaericola]
MTVVPWQRRGVARRPVTDLTGLTGIAGSPSRAPTSWWRTTPRAAIGSVWPRAVAARGEEGGLIYRIAL